MELKFEVLGKIRLYHGDCMDVLKQTPDKYYSLALVDPPYGIDVASMNMGAGKSKKSSNIKNRKWKKKNWDNNTPSVDYFNELFRVSKNQMIWGGNYFEMPACKHYIIWDKQIPEGLSFSDCEYCWTSFDKANRMFRYSAYLDKRGKIHPSQKPIKLYKWLLQNYAKEGDTILDTHFGSLSIGIACHDMKFDLTAIELDKDYYEQAKQRLIYHQRQLTLF